MTLPSIQTERLTLVPFVVEDIDAFHLIWGDPEVIWWGASPSREASVEALAHGMTP